MEVWKDIIGYEGRYQVSNYGRLKTLSKLIKSKSGSFSRRKEKIMKQSKDKNGYMVASLCNDNIRKNVRVHRLIAEAFIPNPHNKTQVNHKNGIKNDNNIRNLEWCTPSENRQHAYNTVLQKGLRGENRSKILKNEDIINIRKLKKNGKTLLEIGEMYNISFQHVSDIVNFKRWKHIKEEK